MGFVWSGFGRGCFRYVCLVLCYAVLSTGRCIVGLLSGNYFFCFDLFVVNAVLRVGLVLLFVLVLLVVLLRFCVYSLVVMGACVVVCVSTSGWRL